MKRKRTSCARVRRAIPALCAALLVLFAAEVGSAQTTSVTVVMENLTWGGCSDFLGPPEIYWVVIIDGSSQNNRADAIFSNFSPINLQTPIEFSQEVDLAKGAVDVRIEQKDSDGFGSDDDVCDISPMGNALDLVLDLGVCAFTGDEDGVCGETVLTTNSFKFHIKVDAPPPSTPSTNVSCLHAPIWAQPGEEVTITATALDGNLQPKEVDTLEFWLDDSSGPEETFSDETSASIAFTPEGDSFSYGCRVVDGVDEAFTGWRTSEVGLPDEGEELVAVLYTGESMGRIDFAFFADEDDYTASGDPPTTGDDPVFIMDVGDAVRDGYYADSFYLGIQNRVNFWIGLEAGDADGWDDVQRRCQLSAPSAPQADTRVVIHLDELRDCAIVGLFSTEAPRVPAQRDPLLTLLHESGHRPFGLADEYCCDGGYFELPVNPNLYAEEESCKDDAPDLGRPMGNCRNFTSSTSGDVWHLSDPTGDDLMEGSGDQTPQASDLRRMNWFLDQCAAGEC